MIKTNMKMRKVKMNSDWLFVYVIFQKSYNELKINLWQTNFQCEQTNKCSNDGYLVVVGKDSHNTDS